jgi:tRNA pseudouridine32 synthase/23S rRNA pseudouridine746 synthase
MKSEIVDNFIAPLCKEHIEFLYQDEHILVINKPSGLLSLSGKNPLNKDSVHWRLIQNYSKAALPHRLDFGTSGVMLIALSKAVNAHLTKQFQARTVNKTYLSLLAGHLIEDNGQIEQPIAKDPTIFPRLKICASEGKYALTEFKVLERRQNPISTLVRYTPVTGRTHQLRLHSQYLQHSILGCDLYGTKVTYQAASRLMLHAESIEFIHPATEKIQRIHCPAIFA